MKFNDIVSISKKVVANVEGDGKLPSKINNMAIGEYGYLLTKAVLNPNKDVAKVSIGGAPNQYNDTINKILPKKDYTAIAKAINTFVSKNKRLPNYVVYQKQQISPLMFIYCFAKIIVFYSQNKRLPNTCNFSIPKKTALKTKGGAVCKAVANRTGVIIVDYKTLYQAFTKFSYQYYYNDQKPKNTTIKDKAGNCADLNQIAYQCLKELKYNVDIVRGEVKCNSGTFGHIWCRLKLSNKTIIFDASAAAKGKAIGSLICGTGKVTNVNPSWLLSDDGKT